MGLLTLMVILQSCSSKAKQEVAMYNLDQKYYTLEDFKSVKKIDAHIHIRTDRTSFIDQAIEDNFQFLQINVYKSYAPSVIELEKRALNYIKEYPNLLHYATAFSLENWGSKNWQEETIDYLDSSIAKGAVGVKVWKNIGMTLKDKNNNFVMVDDPTLDPIFNFIEKSNITLLSHQGEPKDCWLPLDEMTNNANKNYYSGHPEYHMYMHPEYPSYEEQIEARDNMLSKHPDLKVVCVHMGSMEWSLEELAKRLDKYPNMAIDIAARINHLHLHAKEDWQKVHDFFIKYQDRILYGTDIIITEDEKDSPEMRKSSHDIWLRDWKFFTTNEVMNSPGFEGDFKGLKLPREVIDKIYYKNAEIWFPRIQN